MNSPTTNTYSALEHAFDFFNNACFDNRLPASLITLRSSRRHFGYLQKRRFLNIDGVEIAELAMNPGYFALRSAEEVLSTLVHEMAHHWQNHFGKQITVCLHNREWAAKMRSLGLMPSHTGAPGGKQTGNRVSHYILPGQRFDMACAALLATGWSLPWLDRHVGALPSMMLEGRRALAETGLAAIGGDPPALLALENGVALALVAPLPVEKPDRRRFACPHCGIRAWAKAATLLVCGTCGEPLNAEGPQALPSARSRRPASADFR